MVTKIINTFDSSKKEKKKRSRYLAHANNFPASLLGETLQWPLPREIQ